MRDSFDTFYDEIENRLRKEGKLTIKNANDTKSDGANESLRLNNRKWFIRTYSLAEMRACRPTHKIILESVHMADIERFLLKSFDDVHLNLDTHNKMRELNINQPTPIQMQVIPLVLSGYNVFGQSTTGTGKTLCFALPLIMMKLGRDPSFNGAVILVPTRELCQQIKSFLEHFLGVKSVFGGMTTKAGKPRCSKGANGEIYVATPGKLLQQLEKNNFVRDFSHLILDETDKMTSMEFIRNIRAVVEKIRDPRFCVLAATYFDSFQFRNLIKVDVSVFIGNKNAANEHVTQVIKLVDEKFAFVKEMIEKNVLIFVNSKDGADELTMKLRNLFRYEYRTGYSNVSCSDWKRTAIVESLHAGKEQIDRNSIIERFNGGFIDILICTSLLSRGIDFKVDCVINYDCPHTVDDYIHRVGRTGRMRYGIPRNGMAYTLLEKSDRQYALNLYGFWMKSGVKLDDSILALVNE